MGRNLERKVWSLSCKWGSGVTTWRPEGSGGAAQKGVAPIRLGNAEKALGATRPRRDTGSLHAHARALTGTHTTTGCTHVHCARRGPRGGGVEGRSGSRGLAVPPAAPLQRLAQQAAAPARPAQPRQGAAAREPGKGVCPLLRWEPRVGEGRGPGGGARVPIKSPYART